MVNRRTVVDQSTDEARRLRDRLVGALGPPTAIQLQVAAMLARISSGSSGDPLAISTLRGQFADNREWSADPSRPAIICGTVDMIGSRLLFSGYGCGFKSKPLHAGFLGQDSLLVHDEAHLEPAFQKLITAVHDEQRSGRTPDHRPLRVMALTATSRAGSERPFRLSEKDRENEVVKQRIHARKGIAFHAVQGEKGAVAAKIGDLAADYKDSGKAVLIFVRTIDDVNAVTKKIAATKAKYEPLTGTIRGKERDDLVRKPVFRRFRPEDQEGAEPGTVYLICTSAGEVGIDISADHLVCDLTPFDSMAQRFGRVNRRGADDRKAHIDLVYEAAPDQKKKDDAFEQARWRTLTLFQERLSPCDWDAARQDASPASLGNMIEAVSEEQRIAAFTPEPEILPTSDILFDAWALTTIREKLPGRPMVEPYLHGLAAWEPPETHVAWREEVWELRRQIKDESERKQFQKYAAELLDDYPLKPNELLRDITSRVYDRLKKLDAPAETPVWIVADDDSVEVKTHGELIEAGKDELNHKTVLLPPAAGGLERGMLTANSPSADDVADEWRNEKGEQRRIRMWDSASKPDKMRLIREIDTRPELEEDGDEGTAARRYWRWYESPTGGDGEGSKTNKLPVRWQVHTDDVTTNAERFAKHLPLSDELKTALVLAARFHDLGKRRELWQRSIGHMLPRNPKPEAWLAKSGGKMKLPGFRTDYRHEFGSLLDIQSESEFEKLCDDMRDLVLHLIAAHHGRGRPHFPPEEVFDPEPNGKNVREIAVKATQRFARLQRKYGRWGLAYLESLLRAADYAASEVPSEFVEDQS